MAAEGLLLDRATKIPPTGAGPLSVTVPVELAAPPVTLAGFRATERTCGGWMLKAALEVPLNVAVIVAVVVRATALVFTGKLAWIAPAGTLIEACTDAAALLLASATMIPPAGAWAFSVTTAVAMLPPVTLGVFRDIKAEVTGGSTIVRTALCVPLYVAEIVAVFVTSTALVVTAKLADEAPAATTTLEGTCASELLLDSVTTVPPTGAGPFSTAVPVDELPPFTVAGFRLTDCTARVNGFTVNLPLAAPELPEIVAVVTPATALVPIPKGADVDPEGTVTLAGTVTEAVSLDRVTWNPPTGAGTSSVTVPVAA